jgi:OOP family OmpA-OmpF porin
MSATRLAGAAVLFATLFAAAPARAVEPLRLDLGIFGGWHYFATENQLGRDVGSTSENKLHQSGTFGLRVGFIVHPLVVLEAELGLTPTSAKLAGETANGLALNYRAHLLVHILKGHIRPFILAGGGGNTLSSSNPNVLHEDTDGEFHVGVGSKFDIQKNWGFRIDARLYIVPSTNVDKIYATNDFEVTAGFYGIFGAHQAPPKVEAPKVVPNPDLDGDGVLNPEDACETVPGPKENHGCPDKDSDGDGVIDRADKCPHEAGPAENSGCPDKDTDKDGVVDRLDKCPDQAGPPENNGCPDVDTDKDGIPDRLDKCPNEPETENNYQDQDGCPDEVPVAVKKFTGGSLKNIDFDNGKATLRASSNGTLDEVVKVMADYPAVKVEVGGHTDNTGERNANIDLSKARAESVKAYLVGKGISDARITTVGYGPDKPIADNKKASGRAQNRRVELKLVD